MVNVFQGWYPDLVDEDSDDLPRPIVFCGPSGVDKGTLIDVLMKWFPNDQFGFSVSHTTRNSRDGEVDVHVKIKRENRLNLMQD